MSPAADWLEQLEARLEQQLQAFLRANPAQEALLQEQERQEQRQRQRRLLAQAEALRSELLQLAGEIREWRDRAQRAHAAGASDLAARAEQRVTQLMERGRQRWQDLADLGEAAQRGSAALDNQGSSNTNNTTLDEAWAQFELEQELEKLRRRH